MPFEPRRDVIAAAATLIESGAIVAIKGIGGFHLACDARNAEVVTRLRGRKHRTDKPFALMARDLTMIEDYAELSYPERALLAEPVAPIVLLDRKKNGHSLAPASRRDNRRSASCCPTRRSIICFSGMSALLCHDLGQQVQRAAMHHE